MISLERIQDIRFEFDILEPKDEFMHLRNLISKKIEEEKGNVAFWAKLLVKVNNTVDEILNVLDNEHKNETKSHIEIIKRIINNFIFSKKIKYLAVNFVLISNSYKELHLYFLKNKKELDIIYKKDYFYLYSNNLLSRGDL